MSSKARIKETGSGPQREVAICLAPPPPSTRRRKNYGLTRTTNSPVQLFVASILLYALIVIHYPHPYLEASCDLCQVSVTSQADILGDLSGELASQPPSRLPPREATSSVSLTSDAQRRVSVTIDSSLRRQRAWTNLESAASRKTKPSEHLERRLLARASQNQEPQSSASDSNRPNADTDEDIDFIEVAPEVQTQLKGVQRLRSPLAFRDQTTASKREPASRESKKLPVLEAAAVVTEPEQLSNEPTQSIAHSRPDTILDLDHSDAFQRRASQDTGALGGEQTTEASNTNDNSLNRQYLDMEMSLVTEALLGQTAYLVCRLRSFQSNDQLQVSWMRKMQILTSGLIRHTLDERFSSSHHARTNDWVLQIRNVRKDDEGPYECQVNSEPKAASVTHTLRVTPVKMQILESNPDHRHPMKLGEQLQLTCQVDFLGSQTAASLAVASYNFNTENQDKIKRYLYWYKDNVTLQFAGSEAIETRQEQHADGELTSVLTIRSASRAHEGVFTCKLLPELAGVAPGWVQVFADEPSSGTSHLVKGSPSVLLPLTLLVFVCYLTWAKNF